MVLDTNVVAYCFFPGRFSEDAIKLIGLVSDAPVPSLWQSEFRNVLTLYLRKELLSIEEAVEIYSLAEERLTVIQPDKPTPRVLTLVNNSGCSAYDCEFIDLARQLNTLLVTQDKKMLREFPDTAITIADALTNTPEV
ncbi:hypothetical protein MNBD_GAMMA26-424 [hydrothermal vent metagenome]|uniref:PIN domain-containing protein n=1 Tax=hydrothermal vent metagenome TaxID=652676 RepID=A0A3B1B8L5_9ZZZZ